MKLPAGSAGLPSASIVLLDQLRCIDIDRIVNFRGKISPDEANLLKASLKQIFNLF
jgi:mRNA interferase MazF